MSKSRMWPQGIVTSKHFRSALLVILALVTAVYLSALGVLYNQFLTSYRQNAEAKANRLALAVQEQLSSLRTNAIFVGSIKTVERLMAMDQTDNSEIARMVGELGPFFNQSSYESVQVFFARSRRVYVSGVGMYSFDDYFDQRLLTAMDNLSGRELWQTDDYIRYYGDQYPMPVVTYARATPVYGPERNGFVTISIPVAQLHKTAADNLSAGLPGAAVFFGGKLLFCMDGSLDKHYDTAATYEENARAFHGTGRLMLVHSTNDTAVTVSCSAPVFALIRGHLPMLGLIYLGLCAAAFLCALLYSGAMLRSVDRIMSKFGAPAPAAAGSRNEFDRLGSAVDNLNVQMLSMRQTVQKNLPLVRERIVHEIICSYVDLRPPAEDYSEYGLVFPHPYFLVLVVAIPELAALNSRSTREKIGLVAQREAESAFGGLGKVYSTYGDNHNLLFLLNTALSERIEENIREAGRLFCARLFDGLSVSPLISVGICSPDAPVPYHAYIQARRNLIYTYADQEEFLLFSSQSEYTPVVDDSLLGMLTQGVIDRSAAQLGEAVGLLDKAYLGAGGDLRQAQRLSGICACTVFTRLQEMNLDTAEALLEQCLHRIAAADSAEGCPMELHAYLLSLARDEQTLPDKSQRHVHEAIAYIERHYGEDITVPQIAGHTAVNPVYLNKLFKLSTGKTISEYLNFHRIEASRRMLTDSMDTIAAISKRVGYNDARSYIRFFKKFHGVTPNDYRKAAEGVEDEA